MKQLIEEQKKLPKLICDLVWSVTDGGTKIKESQLLSYQDEPVREYEDILNWHKQSLKQFIDGLVESLDGKREKDLSDKDIEDRLRVFTLTPSSEESIKEFVKVIGGISAKMGKNKAINDQISYLEKIRKQLE